MKWHRSFRDQMIECKKTGNQFVVYDPFYHNATAIVCVPFKTYCHPEACYHKRHPTAPQAEKEG
ncbi:unnamed protein product [marine sediment metagenome]|uniref:Uncharacterized protein n=1 Tax=marine sediment metagenome TaxID=412755 RepID=X1F1L2_9ZZZZ